MATTEQVGVQGLKELNEKLEALKSEFQRGALRSAARAGIKVIQQEILARLRGIEHGFKNKYSEKQPPLASDIKIRTARDRSTGGVVSSVGPRKQWSAHKAIWLEYGAQAHVMPIRKAKFFIPGFGWVRRFMHPGEKAHPFMRPAFDGSSQRALAAFRDRLAKSIQKYEKR
jgi:HK97 gp10 family phage protein